MAGDPTTEAAAQAANAAARAADAAVSAGGSAAGAAHSAAGATDAAAGAVTAAAHSGSISYAACILAFASLIAALSAWAAGRRSSMTEQRSAAFAELLEVVHTLRDELKSRVESLDAERRARHRLEDELSRARESFVPEPGEVKRAGSRKRQSPASAPKGDDRATSNCPIG